MKLTPAQIENANRQFAAQAVPQDNRMQAELLGLFGEHTFFLDDDGLHIVEEVADPDQSGAPVARVIKLASWTNAEHTTLATHPPQLTDVVVDLEKAA
jgi:hypothetical protein